MQRKVKYDKPSEGQIKQEYIVVADITDFVENGLEGSKERVLELFEKPGDILELEIEEP